MSHFRVNKVAVLGAGVMGAQIAAHCANADVPVVLFDLAGQDAPNGVVDRALAGLRTLEPAPLAAADRLACIGVANYDQHLDQLRGCDLIIEAIAEKTAWKEELYRRIAPYVAPHAILASNTSGLSIGGLAEALPAPLRARFCGIHFFNPPRYMHLVELVAAAHTEPALLDDLEAWLTTHLGKGIVRCRDTPNFVANRVGVFSILAVMHHTRRLGLGFDAADALTGPRIGRPKSATYRTADIVGLDTLAHVIQTLQDTLAGDPWHGYYRPPAWLSALIGQGALGQKSGAGIFRKEGREIRVLDPVAQDYRPAAGEVAAEVDAILQQKNPAARFAALRASAHPQAEFLWAVFRDVFHYCAYHLAAIADNARDVDFAMRWGFGWSQGPFETWQAAGWPAVAAAVQTDIDAGLTMSDAPLPAWVFEVDGVHAAAGSWSAAERRLKPRSSLPVYGRQLFPDRVVGEAAAGPAEAGETLFANAGVRLWRLPLDPDIAILSVTTRMHTLGRDVVLGLREAMALAERECAGVVVWHEAPFAVGANLKEIRDLVADGQVDRVERAVAEFQQASLALRYARIPVVAAVSGLALGGGCEFLLHCDRRVVALEAYIGLVEAGVGLLPAGGGCKEFALRAARMAARTANNQPFDFIQPVFNTLATAAVSKSAHNARELGFLDDADLVVFHPRELLYVALRQARALAESGYRPPLPPRGIAVCGRTGIATLEMALLNLKEGGMISAHDYVVAKAVATALCGGEIEAGSLVDEDWLLAVERRLFVELLRQEKTQQRIAHMLETGKPLRN